MNHVVITFYVHPDGWLILFEKIWSGIFVQTLEFNAVLWLNGGIFSLFLSGLSSYIYYHYQNAKILDFMKFRALSRLWSLNIPLRQNYLSRICNVTSWYQQLKAKQEFYLMLLHKWNNLLCAKIPHQRIYLTHSQSKYVLFCQMGSVSRQKEEPLKVWNGRQGLWNWR